MNISSGSAARPRPGSDPMDQASAPFQEIPAWQVKEALSEILESSPFRASKQSQKLLRYIVERSLAGDVNLLKERMIGMEVFDRRPDYDTNADPIVRARVAEVRKRLALFYQNEQGKAVRISVPHGSFKAIFESAEEPTAQPLSYPHAGSPLSPIEPEIAPVDHNSAGIEVNRAHSPFRAYKWWIAAGVLLAVTAFLVLRSVPNAEQRAFNHFWAPVLQNSRTVLIYAGGNAVYELTSAYRDEYYKQHPRDQREEMGYETYIQWPAGTKIDVESLFPAKDIFVTIGDVAAITKIESLLVRRDRSFDIRYGGDVTYGDLRQSPTILIGAHNNAWTLTMTENLHYVFDGRNAIVNRANPKERWSTIESFPEDYAVISRILNSGTGSSVVSVAGIGYAGTQAAAEFLTDPHAIASLAKSLPEGWDKKNIQVVLHTSVTNQIPSSADVVATYSW